MQGENALPKLLVGIDAVVTYIKAAVDVSETELAIHKELNNSMFVTDGRRDRTADQGGIHLDPQPALELEHRPLGDRRIAIPDEQPAFSCRLGTCSGARSRPPSAALSASNPEWCIWQTFKPDAVEAQANNLTIHEECDQIVRNTYAENWQSEMMFLQPFFGGPDGALDGFVGGQAGDGVKEMMFRVVGGVAFAHKADILALVSGPDAVPPNVLRMSGGGSKSIIWPQIFADKLQLPVEVAHCSEVGTRRANTPTVALGFSPPSRRPVQAMVKIDRRYRRTRPGRSDAGARRPPPAPDKAGAAPWNQTGRGGHHPARLNRRAGPTHHHIERKRNSMTRRPESYLTTLPAWGESR